MNEHPEYQYLNTLQEILDHGEKVPNRTGVDTYRILGAQHKYDFKHGFPLLTTKKVWFKGVAIELLWFLKGSTDIKYLVDNGVNIWNDDAYRHFKKITNGLGWQPSKEAFIQSIKNYDKGEIPSTKGPLGPVYGKQWRDWGGDYTNKKYGEEWEEKGIDQVENLIDGLKNSPSSRRHILSAWNVADIGEMGLPPCHYAALFSVDSQNKLHCAFNMRSNDVPLGLPFNIASYALLTHMIAHVTGYEAGSVTYWGWDVHIYENQIEGVKEQLAREPYPFPKLWLNPDVKNIDDFTYDDIKILDYKCHPRIDMPLST